MNIIELLLVMLIAFWAIGAIAVMIKKKKDGKCIGCSGETCTYCKGSTASRVDRSREDKNKKGNS
jgi:hypothetical protein